MPAQKKISAQKKTSVDRKRKTTSESTPAAKKVAKKGIVLTNL